MTAKIPICPPAVAASWRRALGLFLAAALVCSASSTASAQSMSCGQAIFRLQEYCGRVKAFADVEYYQRIPMRCGRNHRCADWWVTRLNDWYAGQMTHLGVLRAHIYQQCRPSVRTPPPPVSPPT